MDQNPNSAEAERLLGVAEKLLEARDFNGAKEFAALAQEADPLMFGSDQILAVADVLLASEKRVNGYYYNWYAVLQIAEGSDDQELIKGQYRQTAILLHPEKNKLPYADQAFQLVGEAWAVLSDPARKTIYDRELTLNSKVDPPEKNNSSPPAGKKLPVKRGGPPKAAADAAEGAATEQVEKPPPRASSFWTGCPYCCRLYEFPRQYEDCCLRCQSCRKAFHAVVVPSLPPLLPGKDAYYCPWGGFPFGSVQGTGGNMEAFPSWQAPLPPPFSGYGRQPVIPPPPVAAMGPAVGGWHRIEEVPVGESVAPRKRGRPRKIK